MKRYLMVLIYLCLMQSMLAAIAWQDIPTSKASSRDSMMNPLQLIALTNPVYRLDKSTDYFWMDMWFNTYMREYSYTSKGKLHRIVGKTFLAEEWHTTNMIDYSYDDAGNLVQTYYRSYHCEQWNDDFLYYFTYYPSGELQQVLITYYDGNAWQNSKLYQYEYANGRLYRETESMCSADIWLQSTINTWIYNSSGEISELYNRVIVGDWEFVWDSRKLYSYNAFHNIDFITEQSLESDWTTFGRILYNYDANQNLIERHAQSYSSGSGSWTNAYRYTGTYDNANNETSLVYQLWQNNTWVHYNKTEMEYLPVSIFDDTLPLPSVSFSTYPNPFVAELRISSKSSSKQHVDIFNLRGQKLKSLTLEAFGEVTWDGKDERGKELKSGIYFIRSGSHQSKYSKKIMKW